MKLFLLVIFALVMTANGNPLDRHCECKAVSNTLHIPFHSSGISSCKLCSCNDPAMINCEQACKSLVQSYAQTGCGKIPKGSKVKYSWKASSCSGGISNVEYVCA